MVRKAKFGDAPHSGGARTQMQMCADTFGSARLDTYGCIVKVYLLAMKILNSCVEVLRMAQHICFLLLVTI
jgi:hypothetical protein